jgi:signal transduction histidine kinase
MPKKNNDEPEIPAPDKNLDFLPGAGQFVQTQEEYIRTLEVALKLLQREVENLRQQRRSADQTITQATISSEPSIGMLHTALTVQDVILGLQKHLEERLSIKNCRIYTFTSIQTLVPVGDTPESTGGSLGEIMRHLDEQGIVTWVMEQRDARIIPNISESAKPDEVNIILVPLFLRNVAVGIFIAGSAKNTESFSAEDFAALLTATEAAMMALDNIRSADEIKRMNQRLGVLNKQMLQSSKLASIGELAGSVAHEVNNPLQILLAHLQLLESGVGNSERRIEIIKQQVHRISDITRRLLDFARNTPTETNTERVDVNFVINEVLFFINSQLNRDGIQVYQECEEPSPIILAAKTQIEQALLNLMLNARDAMPEGGTITITSSTANNKAYITIADTGVGIPQENLISIFEPFYSTKPRGKGTGLGLSIVRTIIQQFRGDIQVSSQEGKGTTFKLAFPLMTS